MKPLVLIDPWLVRFDGDDASDRERMSALDTFARFTARHQVDAVRFPTPLPVRPEEMRELRTMPARIRNIVTDLHDFVPRAPVADAALLDAPVPADLGTEWLQALYRSVDPDASRWRDPSIIVSSSRRREWPRSPEIRIRAAGEPVPRVLATIEALTSPHSLVRRDLDLWALEPLAGGNAPHVLPRPPQLENTRIDEWPEILERIDDWRCGRETHRYFVPRLDDPPHTMSRDDWRARKCFPRQRKRRKSGYVGSDRFEDRWGRVWCWDVGHKAHWDVQEEGAPDFDRVKVDGLWVGKKPSKAPKLRSRK